MRAWRPEVITRLHSVFEATFPSSAPRWSGCFRPTSTCARDIDLPDRRFFPEREPKLKDMVKKYCGERDWTWVPEPHRAFSAIRTPVSKDYLPSEALASHLVPHHSLDWRLPVRVGSTSEALPECTMHASTTCVWVSFFASAWLPGALSLLASRETSHIKPQSQAACPLVYFGFVSTRL